MSSIPKIEPWQIRIGYVRFPDKPSKGKARPLLVLQVSGDYAYCLKITTVPESDFYPRMVLDHAALGLIKPSWLQIQPVYRVALSDIRDCLGKCSLGLAMRISSEIEREKARLD